MSINDFSYDPDTNSYFYRGITAYVHHISGHINGYSEDPDLLMKKAGYVQGDDALLTNPAILHRDMDPLDFSSENLEFVERTDPKYQNYLAVLDKYRAKREAELVEKSKELG